MSRLGEMAAEDGWFLTLSRVSPIAWRQLRNGLIGRRLGSPGLYCGHAPRLLGLRHMRIGHSFHAGDHVWLHAIASYAGRTGKPELVIGNNVTFSENVHIGCLVRVEIGDGCLFGSRVLVIDHAHGCYRGPQQSPPDQPPAQRPLHSNGPVRIGRNVWLGDGVAVLPGADIGEGAIIAANSVVTGAIPPQTIAVGVPARPVRRWDTAAQQWTALP